MSMKNVCIDEQLSGGQKNLPYRDYGDLLADPDVDAVEIMTPHHLHAWVFMPLEFVVRWPSPALISLTIQKTQAFLCRYSEVIRVF